MTVPANVPSPMPGMAIRNWFVRLIDCAAMTVILFRRPATDAMLFGLTLLLRILPADGEGARHRAGLVSPRPALGRPGRSAPRPARGAPGLVRLRLRPRHPRPAAPRRPP